MQRYRSGYNGPDSKSGVHESVPWVRIPPAAPKKASFHAVFAAWELVFCFCVFVKNKTFAMATAPKCSSRSYVNHADFHLPLLRSKRLEAAPDAGVSFQQDEVQPLDQTVIKEVHFHSERGGGFHTDFEPSRTRLSPSNARPQGFMTSLLSMWITILSGRYCCAMFV